MLDSVERDNKGGINFGYGELMDKEEESCCVWTPRRVFWWRGAVLMLLS